MAARKRPGVSRQTPQSKGPRDNAGTNPTSRRRRVNGTDSDHLEPQDTSSIIDDETDGNGTDLEDTRAALEELQNAMAREEKGDTFDTDMEKKVKQDERRLIKLVRDEEKKRKAEDEEFQSHFASLLTEALGITPTSRTTENATDTSERPDDFSPAALKERHPLYIKSQQLLGISNALLGDMNGITEYTSNINAPPLPTQEWEKDHAEMRRLIQAGRQTTEMKIGELLSSRGRYNEGRGVGIRGSRRSNIIRKRKREIENDENLQTMLNMNQEDGESDDSEEDQNLLGWGVVAHQIDKGMHAFFKALD